MNSQGRHRESSVTNQTSSTQLHRVSTHLLNSCESSPSRRAYFNRTRSEHGETTATTRRMDKEGEIVPLIVTKHALVVITSRL